MAELEEWQSRRWLAIYGAVIAAQVQSWYRDGQGGVPAAQMKHFMEEAAAVATLEAEVRVKSYNEGEPLP